MKKEELLKKMEMPAAKKPAAKDDMLAMDEMDFEVEPMDAEDESAPSPLADASDEDLMAEFKKRGLKLEMEPAEDEAEMEMA